MAQQPEEMTADVPASEPDELRREIARTRADMGATVGEIEDRVSPRRIRERQADRLRGGMHRARVAVMGEPGSARQQVSERAGHVTQAVGQAPERARRSTQGNPLAAGMIAFGAGALAGTLLPATELERRVAAPVRDTFEGPVRDQLEQSGQAVSASLREEGRRAGEEVKATAQQATDDVRHARDG